MNKYIGLFELTEMTVKTDSLTEQELNIALETISVYGINYIPLKNVI